MITAIHGLLAVDSRRALTAQRWPKLMCLWSYLQL
jgi:hypothetical protein